MILEELQRSLPEATGYELIREEEVAFPPADADDALALKTVVQNMEKAEGWIQTKGYLLEWRNFETLYHFQVPTQNWEGTKVPRAHLGIPLVYEHVESIVPQLMSGLFADDPPFLLKPYPGTSMDVARANTQLLQWQVEQSGLREECRLGFKSLGIFGTAIWKLGWKQESRTRKIWRRKQNRTFVPTGMGGVQLPTKKSDQLENVEITEEISHPTVEFVPLTHVLVDPKTRRQDIQYAGYVIHRMYLTALDLDALRDQEGYDIPTKDQLKRLFFPPKEEPKQSMLEMRTVDYTQEYKAMERPRSSSVDPLQQPLEVLEYWTRDKVYTVVQRKLVIRNEDNEFGELPFRSLAFSDLPDAFYGFGIAKVIGNEQRVQQGVINTFLDDLSLTLNGMFVRVRGMNTPTQQLRMRPGGIIDSDDKEGVHLLERQPIPVGEVNAVLSSSDARAQRHTGASEPMVQGAMPSQKSSITRTATGVNALGSGTGTRLQYLVENFATLVFIPTLKFFHRMNAIKLAPSQIERILSKEMNSAFQGDVVDLINGGYDFQVLAASRLQTRKSMAESLPLIFQFVLTEPVIQALATEGKKPNVSEMVKMVFDVTGWPNKQDVIVDMTPEDEQRMAAQNPAVQQAAVQQQKASTDLDSKKQVIEEENVARSGRDIIKTLLKGAEGSFLGMNEKQSG